MHLLHAGIDVFETAALVCTLRVEHSCRMLRAMSASCQVPITVCRHGHAIARRSEYRMGAKPCSVRYCQ